MTPDQRDRLRRRIKSFMVDDDPDAVNLASLIHDHFAGHNECPDRDDDDECLEWDDSPWEWAVERTDAAIERLLDAIEEALR